MEPVHFVTSDGHHLSGDVAEAGAEAVGAVVVCHPHPLLGGDRFNPVVDAMFTAFALHGLHALRFDFRAEHGDGIGERLDVVAALDVLAERHPGLALHTAGYSFGAMVTLAVDDERIVRKVAVAPPLGRMATEPPRQPTLVLVAEHDQFCPPEVAAPIVATWPAATLEVVEAADHFLAGRVAFVAGTAAAWLTGG